MEYLFSCSSKIVFSKFELISSDNSLIKLSKILLSFSFNNILISLFLINSAFNSSAFLNKNILTPTYAHTP